MVNTQDVYENFDWVKYTQHYPDLNYINNKEDALHHWTNFGKNEGRIYFHNDFIDPIFNSRRSSFGQNIV